MQGMNYALHDIKLLMYWTLDIGPPLLAKYWNVAGVSILTFKCFIFIEALEGELKRITSSKVS